MKLQFAHLSALARVAALAAVLIAGCGGSTSPVTTYHPQRLVVFGDESSALVDDGNQNALKYSVNGISALTNVRDCTTLPIWVQSVAASFGFVFPECNPGGITNPGAVMRARPGAKVEDPAIGLSQQIAEQQSFGLGTGDLVTVMIGANDVLELYNQVQNGQLSQPDALAEARRRAAVVAGLVNQLLALNVRLILATIPNQGETPYAIAAEQLVAGSRALLSQLSIDFNASLRTRIDSAKYDGRNYGLVLGDDLTASAVANPQAFLAAPANVTEGVCAVTLPRCTSAPADLVPDANVNSYLWADASHLGPQGHSRIASAAVARATTLPF